MKKVPIKTRAAKIAGQASPPVDLPRAQGYPPVITRPLIKKIVDSVRQCCYFSTACQGAGVSERLGSIWAEMGERVLKKLEAGEKATPSEALYLDFILSVREAEALAELEMVVAVMEHQRNWQAAAWILGRKSYRRWGTRQDPAEPGAAAKPPQTMVLVMPDGAKLSPREFADANTVKQLEGNKAAGGSGQPAR